MRYGCLEKHYRLMFPDSTPHICDSRPDIVPSAQIGRDAALPHFGACPFHCPGSAKPAEQLLMTRRILYLNRVILILSVPPCQHSLIDYLNIRRILNILNPIADNKEKRERPWV